MSSSSNSRSSRRYLPLCPGYCNISSLIRILFFHGASPQTPKLAALECRLFSSIPSPSIKPSFPSYIHSYFHLPSTQTRRQKLKSHRGYSYRSRKPYLCRRPSPLLFSFPLYPPSIYSLISHLPIHLPPLLPNSLFLFSPILSLPFPFPSPPQYASISKHLPPLNPLLPPETKILQRKMKKKTYTSLSIHSTAIPAPK